MADDTTTATVTGATTNDAGTIATDGASQPVAQPTVGAWPVVDSRAGATAPGDLPGDVASLRARVDDLEKIVEGLRNAPAPVSSGGDFAQIRRVLEPYFGKEFIADDEDQRRKSNG